MVAVQIRWSGWARSPSAGRIAATRKLPPGPGARVEVEAGLAAARVAEPSVAVEDADELQLVGTFLRRPPPELRVAPLEADVILRLAAALPGHRGLFPGIRIKPKWLPGFYRSDGLPAERHDRDPF